MKNSVSCAFCWREFQGKVFSYILGFSLRSHFASWAQNSDWDLDKEWRGSYNACCWKSQCWGDVFCHNSSYSRGPESQDEFPQALKLLQCWINWQDFRARLVLTVWTIWDEIRTTASMTGDSAPWECMCKHAHIVYIRICSYGYGIDDRKEESRLYVKFQTFTK